MTKINASFSDSKTVFKNSDRPFTELLWLAQYLEPNVTDENNKTINNSDTEVLRAIQKHTENIIYELHNGIQHVSAMLADAMYEPPGADSEDIAGVGFLINIIANAAEGCADLKTQTEKELVRRGAEFI